MILIMGHYRVIILIVSVINLLSQVYEIFISALTTMHISINAKCNQMTFNFMTVFCGKVHTISHAFRVIPAVHL